MLLSLSMSLSLWSSCFATHPPTHPHRPSHPHPKTSQSNTTSRLACPPLPLLIGSALGHCHTPASSPRRPLPPPPPPPPRSDRPRSWGQRRPREKRRPIRGHETGLGRAMVPLICSFGAAGALPTPSLRQQLSPCPRHTSPAFPVSLHLASATI